LHTYLIRSRVTSLEYLIPATSKDSACSILFNYLQSVNKLDLIAPNVNNFNKFYEAVIVRSV
jgi:hypothetical protein